MIDKELHARLEALEAKLLAVQEKMELKKVLHSEGVTLRELKARRALLTEQLNRNVKDPEGIGFLETAFRRFVNRLDFDQYDD